jgi:hypothetical protein
MFVFALTLAACGGSNGNDGEDFAPSRMANFPDMAKSTTSTGGKRVFVTSTGYSAQFPGLGAADSLCNAAATAGGLGGTFVAWLSDDTTDALDRVQDASPWYLTDGVTKVFGTHAQLQTQPTVVIDRDENGHQVPSGSLVWTGTQSGGSSSGSTCESWQTADGEVDGTAGSTALTGQWTLQSEFDTPCGSAFSLYCFEQ